MISFGEISSGKAVDVVQIVFSVRGSTMREVYLDDQMRCLHPLTLTYALTYVRANYIAFNAISGACH